MMSNFNEIKFWLSNYNAKLKIEVKMNPMNPDALIMTIVEIDFLT